MLKAPQLHWIWGWANMGGALDTRLQAEHGWKCTEMGK